MTKDEMKKNLRAMLNSRPENESVLDMAINHSTQSVKDATIWSWLVRSKSLTTTSSATVAMPSDVEIILEMTYGSNNRVITPVSHSRISELYNDTDRTGDTIYYYTINKSDSDHITVEFVPIVASQTVTYRYLTKIEPGDLSAIPPKLHPLIQVGARAFIEAGAPEASPIFLGMLDRAMIADRPIVHRRWAMGLDGAQRRRIDERNAIRSAGSSQDISHPYD